MANNTNAQGEKPNREGNPQLTPVSVASVALLAGSYYVPKDFMAPGVRRVLVQVAGCAAAFGIYILGVRDRAAETAPVSADQTNDQHFREEVLKKLEADGPVGGVEPSSDSELKSKLVGFGILAGLGGLIGASIWATLRLDKWAVGTLRKRGVKYPNSLWGAVSFAAGVATLAFDD